MSKAVIITDTPNLLNGMPNLSQKTQWQSIDCRDWKGILRKTWIAIGGNPEATPKTLSGLEPWRQIMILANSPI